MNLIKRIYVNTILKSLGQGISDPALIIGDDFEQYILKTEKVYLQGKYEKYNCMFLNELLSFQIATFLEVPIPEAAIAYMDKRIIEEDATATFVHRFYEGDLFASKQLKNVENNIVDNYEEMRQMNKPYISRTWNSFFSDVKNIADVAKIIAFDILVANFDRYGNDGNLLVSQTDSGRMLFAIDHGHSFFGPEWITSKINGLKAPEQTLDYCDKFIQAAFGNNINNGYIDGLGIVFDSIQSNINLTDVKEHSFSKVVDKIEDISEDKIDEWMGYIPDEWFVEGEKQMQIAYYKSFILKQKYLVRFIIQRMAERRAFVNYLGGELQWKKDRSVNIV